MFAKASLFRIVFLLFFLFPGIHMSGWLSGEISAHEKGKLRALLIGNSDYSSSGIADLVTSINDIEAVSETLVQFYGYEREDIQLIKNGSREEILKGLYTLGWQTRSEDTVLIYYAGHGEFDEHGIGWWIPVGAEANYDYISDQEIILRIKTIPAHSVLLISDSCFSGSFGEYAAKKDPDEGKSDQGVESSSSHIQVIASGGNAPVYSGGPKWGGHSIFAYHLITRLRSIEQEKITASELSSNIREYVTEDAADLGKEQIPNLFNITPYRGLEEEFIFRRHDPEKPGSRENIMILFAVDSEDHFYQHGKSIGDGLFAEFREILQRNRIQLCNTSFEIISSAPAGEQINRIEIGNCSRVMVFNVETSLKKHRTKIWSALSRIKIRAQLYNPEMNSLLPGDSFVFKPQALPIDTWDTSEAYKKEQLERTVEKFIRRYDKVGFATFLKKAVNRYQCAPISTMGRLSPISPDSSPRFSRSP